MLNYSKTVGIYFVFCLTTGIAIGQNFDQYFPDFYANGKKLSIGACGGLRNPQFSNIDFNGDGILDLFVFDKTGNKPLCFINKTDTEGIQFEYAPQYESAFPRMNTWAILHDFNLDGVEDIFTLPKKNIGGIQVYVGSRHNGNLSYRLMQLEFENTITYRHNGAPTAVYNAITDIPAILDVDHDGDTDVLAFDADGGKIIYYDNVSKQKGFQADTFIMELKDYCFGRIYESMFSSSLFLSSDSIDCATGNIIENSNPRHSGSTLLGFDDECDGKTDVIIGDVSNGNIVFLKNKGAVINNWFTAQELNYPPSSPVQLFIFNATFMVDVDNDKVKDLIVVPNETDGGVNQNHIWLYLNKGSNCNPDFVLETMHFLGNGAVNVSAKSNVTFIDINGDGKKDILMSGNGLNSQSSNAKFNHLFYFKNTSLNGGLEYTLESDDYLSLSALTGMGTSMSVTAGDADGDGDDDLYIGAAEFLYYIENKAGAGKPANWANFIYPFMDLKIGSSVSPSIYDVNDDGVNDLLIGEDNYSLNYYKNLGSKGSSPVFAANPETDDFGHIFKTLIYFNRNNSPTMVRDYEGNEWAVIGFESGDVNLYKRKKDQVTDSLILISERLGNIYAGTKSAPELIDVDDNGYYDIVMGNFRGGISFYHTNIPSRKQSATNDFYRQITIYPNPTSNELNFNIDSHYDQYLLSIYNQVGQLVYHKNILKNETIDISTLIEGFYIINITNEKKEIFTSSFIKL